MIRLIISGALLLSLLMMSLFTGTGIVHAADSTNFDKLRTTEIGDAGHSNSDLDSFATTFRNFFFSSPSEGGAAVEGSFIFIAYNIKNFFIVIAVIFLIIGVIKLLFSSNDEEDMKTWRRNVIWTSIGIIVMQIAYSVWYTLIIRDNSTIGAGLGWEIWRSIFEPIVRGMYMLAAFGFLAMAVYAFYRIVSAAGEEEKIKKGKMSFLYAIIGFFLIQVPKWLIEAIYGKSPCADGGTISLTGCAFRRPDLSEAVGVIGKIFMYFNGFLALICVLLVLYAGWLVFISGGDEENLKKAKRIVIYIVIGFIVLVGSNALFRFFILQG